MENSIFEKLEQLEKSDIYPFHMPGHKRNSDIAYIPAQVDITEIDGFDNLHHATGILKNAQQQASDIYHSDRTWYLVNGSTVGILIAISAVCTNKGGTVLIARNCHKAVYNAVYLNRLNVKYLYPKKVEFDGVSIFGSISAEQVKRCISENNDIKAVVITSPTYDGIVSDISNISKICHENNIPLIVDEAHGAHFVLGEEFPKSALECGADVVIHSLHKTLPSMTQTALIHLKGNLVSEKLIERYSGIYQTSSPSYVMMAGMDSCVRFIENDGRKYLDEYLNNMHKFSKAVENLKMLKVYIKNVGLKDVFDKDISKILIFCSNAIEKCSKNKYDGQWLYDELLHKYHLQMEMAEANYVIALTSILDRKDGFERLAEALLEIDEKLVCECRINCEKSCFNDNLTEEAEQLPYEDKMSFEMPAPKIEYSVYEALTMPTKTVSLKECAGFISAEYIYLYPPGCPIVVPGERLSQELVDIIMDYKSGNYNVEGLLDKNIENIEVLFGEK